MYYPRLIRRLARLSFLRQVMYKTDVWFYALSVVSFAITQIFFLYFLFGSSKNPSLGGYTRDQMLFVYLMSQWTYALFFAFSFDNLKLLGNQLTEGLLDFYFLYPGSITFHTMFQKVSFRNTLSILAVNTLATVLIMPHLQLTLSLYEYMQSIFILVTSCIILHCMYMNAISLLFFLREFWGPWNFLSWVADITRYPKGIYPWGIQLFFLTVVPYFWSINPLYSITQHEYAGTHVLQQLGFTILYTLLSSMLWQKALEQYESAN